MLPLGTGSSRSGILMITCWAASVWKRIMNFKATVLVDYPRRKISCPTGSMRVMSNILP